MLRMLKVDFYRAITNFKFYLAIVGVIVVCYVSTYRYLGIESELYVDVYYALGMLIDLSMLKKLIVFFSALPVVMCFCEEWKNRYTRSAVLRCGKEAYVGAKNFTCILISFLTTAIGISLFLIIYRVFWGVEGSASSYREYPPYGTLIDRNGFLYLFIIISIFSLAMSVWTMVGLVISAYVPNPFVALCTPFITSYLIQEMGSMFLPPYLDMYALTNGSDVIQGSPLETYLYTMGVFLCMLILLGYWFGKIVKGRIGDERI